MAEAGGPFAVTDRPRALAVLITVFLLGCLLGFAGSYFWFGKTPEPQVAVRENGPPRIQKPPRLSELLQLTPEQDQRFHDNYAIREVSIDRDGKPVHDETGRPFTYYQRISGN